MYLVLGRSQLVSSAGQQMLATLYWAPFHRVRSKLGVHCLQRSQNPRAAARHRGGTKDECADPPLHFPQSLPTHIRDFRYGETLRPPLAGGPQETDTEWYQGQSLGKVEKKPDLKKMQKPSSKFLYCK